MELKKLNKEDSEISYRISGNGEYTLLFVHGLYFDQTSWEQQISYFTDEYLVVTLDLPGHGNSGKDRKKWTIDGFAEDVNFVITELNLQNVILIGHSLGATVNLITATSNPESCIGFIGIESFKNVAESLTEVAQEENDSILKNLKDNFADTNEAYSRAALFTEKTPKAITEKIVESYRNAFEPMAQQIMPQSLEAYKIENELLPKLAFKLHLTEVDYSPTNVPELEKLALEGIDVQYMKGTSHYPMLENPDELNKLLENAIDSVLTEVKNNSY